MATHCVPRSASLAGYLSDCLMLTVSLIIKKVHVHLDPITIDSSLFGKAVLQKSHALAERLTDDGTADSRVEVQIGRSAI
eukprot:6181191-Pleurochrysis_carterae.AAC.3